MPKSLIFIFLVICLILQPSPVLAQRVRSTPSLKPTLFSATPIGSESAQKTASSSATEAQQLEKIIKDDLTKPEESTEKAQTLSLFEKRPLNNISYTNFMAVFVRGAFNAGVPVNTIILILLLPFLATMVVFIRQIIGLPSMELLVPIAFSITLISTGILAGIILLFTIMMATTFSRIILRRVKIMQLPKTALSMLVVTTFVFIALTASAVVGVLSVKHLSFFPILLLILLSDKISTIQFTRSFREVMIISSVTLMLGVVGYFILSNIYIRDMVLLYPEVILMLIPINLLMGRYFGLRLSEFYRFSYLRKHGNQ